MRPVKIKSVVLGEGMPKICVPIVGRNEAELIAEAEKALKSSCDLIEWRVDFFDQSEQISEVLETGKKLKEFLHETPLLFTFRTEAEGGEKAISQKAYFELYRKIVSQELADLIDVEYFLQEDLIESFIDFVKKTKAKVIMSSHDFQKTPSKEQILSRLKGMQDKGADICKMAVMPHNSQDVLCLLDATETFYRNYAEVPVITMSMGDLGKISRISGEIFGSALTFGSAVKASAPGQVPVEDLKEIVKVLHIQ